MRSDVAGGHVAGQARRHRHFLNIRHGFPPRCIGAISHSAHHMSPQTLSAGRAIVNRIAHPGRRFSGCARALCIARLRGALCRGFFVLLASIDTMPQAEGAIRSSCAVQRRPSGHRIDHMGRRAKAPWGARWAQGWSRSAEYPVEHDVRERFLPGHGGDDRDHSIGGRGGAAGADSAGGLPRWLPTWTPQAVRSPPCVPLKPLFCRGYSPRGWIPASGWIPKKTALSLAKCRASPSRIREATERNRTINGLAGGGESSNPELGHRSTRKNHLRTSSPTRPARPRRPPSGARFGLRGLRSGFLRGLRIHRGIHREATRPPGARR